MTQYFSCNMNGSGELAKMLRIKCSAFRPVIYRPETGGTSCSHPRRPVLCAFHLACLLLIAACSRPDVPVTIIESEQFKFDDLFTVVDTVRLDASVLIGHFTFLDVSTSGNFLIADRGQKALHLFSPSGGHIRTFSTALCNPEKDPTPQSARFLADGSMLVNTYGGTHLFTAEGACVKSVDDWPNHLTSFCERSDSVYVLSRYTPNQRALVFSSALDFVRDHSIPSSNFPGIARIFEGKVGRGIACLGHGVYYRYPESSDGRPLFGAENAILHKPFFFRPLSRDRTASGQSGMNDRVDEFLEIISEYTLSTGIFALDEDHRMLTFTTESLNQNVPTAINIVSLKARPSMSILTERRGIRLAKNGLLFLQGDYEVLANGEYGNPILEVLRFTP